MNNPTDWGTVIALLVGTFFTLVGNYGLLKLPDVFCRMHAATKASTLGLASFMLAAFMHLGTQSLGIKSFVAIVFAYLTAPVGAHMIAQAAYKRRVPLCSQSVCDELHPDYTEEDYGGDALDTDD